MVWADLVEFLKGDQLPGRKLPKANLHQFEVVEESLYYVVDKSDGSLHHEV